MSKYTKLNDLKIIRVNKNKIYKFNYKYPEKYLSKYNNEDFKKIISEIISIIKISEIKDYLSLKSLPNPLPNPLQSSEQSPFSNPFELS